MSHMSNGGSQAKEDHLVAPDSTTADRMVFAEGEDVLFHGEDGLFYFGTVRQVEANEDKCLVQFGDDTERWAHYRSLRKVKVLEDADATCILCKSTQNTHPANQIFMCHYCRRGYHKNCHKPPIPQNYTVGESQWMCSRCVEKRQHRESLGTSQNSSPAKASCRHSLPYDFSELHWDKYHQTNAEGKYCYCGQSGEWFRRMLQCCRCCQWFHDACTSVFNHRRLLFGDRFFLFLCSVCNGGEEERLTRLSTEFSLADIAHLALFNLTLETGKKFHDLDKSVLPFVERNWNYFDPAAEIASLTPNEKRNKILAAFWQYKNRFVCGRELKKKKTMWGLRSRLPPPFPTDLAEHSQRILQLWGSSEMLSLHRNMPPSTPVLSEASPPAKKRPGAPSVEERKKKHPPLDPEHQRTLRVRQQQQQQQQQVRTASDGSSVCDESSDDLKLRKRKRTNGSSSVSLVPTPVETSSDETGSRGSFSTLDVLLPPPKNFEGLNNPFCGPMATQYSTSNPNHTFVRPLKTRLSEKDIRITKKGEIKRKRYVRKWKQQQLRTPTDSFGSNFITPVAGKEVTAKESVMSYFGAEERVARGEKFTIHGRRVLADGPVQYLVQWETDHTAT